MFYEKSGSYVYRTDANFHESGLTFSVQLMWNALSLPIFEAGSPFTIFSSALGIIHFGKKYWQG